MKRTIFFAIILILMVQFTLAEPGYPNFWRGDVNINGAQAPTGTLVESVKGGITVDSCFTGVDCMEANPTLNMYEVGALGIGGEIIVINAPKLK